MQTTTEERVAPSARLGTSLPETGFLRLSQIIGRPATKRAPAVPALIPVSKSAWWRGVKSRTFPQPMKLSEKVTVWRVEQIRELIEQLTTTSHEA